MPQETLFDEAVPRLIEHFPTAGFALTNIELNFYTLSPQLSGGIYDDRGKVGSIRVDTPVPLSELLLVLDTPVCIIADSGVPQMVIIFWRLKEMLVWGFIPINDASVWKPDVDIQHLFVIPWDNQCDVGGAVLWQGFAPLWYYEQPR